MPDIKTTLTTEEYAILKKTQELMRIAGGAAETPDAYAEFILKGAIASYAVQHDENTVESLKNVLSIKEAAYAREKAAREALESQAAVSKESPAP